MGRGEYLMKVVTIEELKNMPDGTVFAEFTPNIYTGELMILDGTRLNQTISGTTMTPQNAIIQCLIAEQTLTQRIMI